MPQQEAKSVLPGAGSFTWQEAVEPDARDVGNANPDAHRAVVLVDVDVDEPTALGLMRWCLELGRQWEHAQAISDFGLFVATAIERTYVGRGLGGASVYNYIPTIRDANAAASELVNRTFPESAPSNYLGPHGNLWRPTGGPDLDTLAARLVVFAFQHRRDVVAQAAADGLSLDDELARLDSSGPLWWSRLMQDVALTRSTDDAFRLIPDRETIERVDLPVKAWSDLLVRLDHDHDHGLAVLEPLL